MPMNMILKFVIQISRVKPSRLLAGWVTTLWLSCPLLVSQHVQLSHPSLSGW